jgi:hypothetical protein
MMCMSVKFQITLPDDLAYQLKRAAARRKTPLAQFIRETMQDKLLEPPKRNAFLDRITGIVDSDETDLASRVDEILYGPGNEHT